MSYALLANPNTNFYETRNKDVRLIALHVTAGLEDLDMVDADQSAEGTNRYGATTQRAVSWHVCVDSDSIAPALPDEYTAFHVKGYNSMSLGLEISNKDARWDNKPQSWIDATLRNAALVCIAWEKKFSIPRVLLTKADVDAGYRGYSYHMFLDPDRRSDPGSTFPLDYFWSILNSLEGEVVPVPSPPAPSPQPSRKSIAQLADEAMAGAFGSGDERKSKLGSNYEAVQAEINRRVNGTPVPPKPPAHKSLTQVAAEVIAGKWGSGPDRIRRLSAAGHNPSAVQAEVNRRLR